MKNIVIIGSGGLATEVKCLIDAINRNQPQWNLLGFIDDWDKRKGDEIIDGYKITGTTEDLNNVKEELYAIIAFGNPPYIKEAAEKIRNPLIKFANLIHPSVEINSSQHMGQGNVFCFGTFISCNVTIGDFNILNFKCIVAHDAQIGSFNVFHPDVRISGSVSVGDHNLFGMNTSVYQGIRIGDENKFGAYSFVTRNINNRESLFGIPAKKM